MTRPNFFIVGAPKCGTTSLYKHLQKHPDVFLTTPKEPYSLVKPKSLLGSGPNNLGTGINSDMNWYYSLYDYDDAKNKKIVGEASAGYLYFHATTIREIKKAAVPNPKIVILLRNPVERAFSSHIHHVRRGDEFLSFKKAIQAQEKRQNANWWFGYQLVNVGLYYTQVMHYLQEFENVHIILFDELKRSPETVFAKLCCFLEISPGLMTKNELTKKHNVNIIPRFKSHYNRLNQYKPYQKIMFRLKKLSFFQNIYDKFLNHTLYKPIISGNNYNWALNFFEDDIQKLEKLLGVNLESWRSSK